MNNSLLEKRFVTVPVFETYPNGSIVPNPLFHRSWDKLHSRCIEYPFAASKIDMSGPLLDVGTTKADPVWIDWLRQLPCEVHATDYDPMENPVDTIQFHQGDVRALPLEDCTFTTIVAVSVIEHIGLPDPQVISEDRPAVKIDGDLQAVKELSRLLKPGGKLIMTLPFGVSNGLILGGSARCYDRASIKKFDEVLERVNIEYYEYQAKDTTQLFHEGLSTLPVLSARINATMRRVLGKLHLRVSATGEAADERLNSSIEPRPGLVTWRRIPLDHASATHSSHSDGVVCGVWQKPAQR